MRKQILAAVLMLSVTSLWAAPAASTGGANPKTVEKLLELTHADNTAKMLQSQVQQSLAQQVQQLNLTAADKPIVDKYSKELSTTILPELSWAKLKPDMVSAYSTTFTEGEITDLIKFYTSKTGQSYLQKAPQLSQLTMTSTQNRLRALLPKLQDISRRLDAELQAKHKAAPAPAPKK
jgi:hypothetical protein